MTSNRTPPAAATPSPAEPTPPVAAAPKPSIIVDLGDGMVLSISGGTPARQAAAVHAAITACLLPRPPKRSAAEAEVEDQETPEKGHEKEEAKEKPKKKRHGRRPGKAHRTRLRAQAMAHHEKKEREENKEKQEEVAKEEEDTEE